MQDFPAKVDGVSTLPASEYNNLASELKNVVESLGITLSGASIIQLSQSISTLSLIGQFYLDSGAADSYVLGVTPVTRNSPPTYFNGMTVEFVAGNANTGASTVNVAGLGSKDIKKADGVTALVADDIKDEGLTTLWYDGTNFILQQSGVLNSDAIVGQQVGFGQNFDGEVATGSTVIPQDDSVPDIAEGDEYITLVYTPKKATNRLDIRVLMQGSTSSGGAFTASLFQDAISAALRSGVVDNGSANNNLDQVLLNHSMVAGTTSPITFRVRIGGVSGTFTFNGESSSRLLGGNLGSGIIIKEMEV